MLTLNLGYPRIGSHRELKKVCENYWAGRASLNDVVTAGKNIRKENWLLQKDAGIDMIPSNDFSFYDHVLDHSFMFGAIPARYHEVIQQKGNEELDLYFAMARGYQKDGLDVTAMEMTKWFDTNYHYIVPEFYPNQQFKLFSTKAINEFYEAKQQGIITRPVLIGPVSYLLLGKEKEQGFNKLSLIRNLLPVYADLIRKLQDLGMEWLQLDEPFLATDLSPQTRQVYIETYKQIRKEFPFLKIFLTTYFEGLRDNAPLAAALPVNALHIDLVRDPGQISRVISLLPPDKILSLGLVDGRNVWKNDFRHSLELISYAQEKLGRARVWISPSCSLLHSPCDLDNEPETEVLPAEIKQWLAFARQKLSEVVSLGKLASGERSAALEGELKHNQQCQENRRHSPLIHNVDVRERVKAISPADARRNSTFSQRKEIQQQKLGLPLFPTTTIGSFPQTSEVRSWRAGFKKLEINEQEYVQLLEKETAKVVKWQEAAGLDVLVHGEFERNDMVEYFGEQLRGFTFTTNGWVQSYGSRCVKPPVIFGDVWRPAPMTVRWSAFAQSLTSKWMKGMLTGPVTILQWSFVRNDQPRAETCAQIALAIRDEVCDLEKAGIRIIQIDEPAIREGLPLRQEDRPAYLDWAIRAFRIAASGVADSTQIHTHMCYSEFNDIIGNIAEMDADVITIETSRSQMELLDAFADFRYPNDIGPGVYDIHSPRVPSREEMVELLKKATEVIPHQQLWVNPDCGLKTRGWNETMKALTEMVAAAHEVRQTLTEEAEL